MPHWSVLILVLAVGALTFLWGYIHGVMVTVHWYKDLGSYATYEERANW